MRGIPLESTKPASDAGTRNRVRPGVLKPED
jgi:hypothetical protein